VILAKDVLCDKGFFVMMFCCVGHNSFTIFCSLFQLQI